MLLAGDIGGTKTDLAVFTPERGPRTPIVRKRFLSGTIPAWRPLRASSSRKPTSR